MRGSNFKSLLPAAAQILEGFPIVVERPIIDHAAALVNHVQVWLMQALSDMRQLYTRSNFVSRTVRDAPIPAPQWIQQTNMRPMNGRAAYH